MRLPGFTKIALLAVVLFKGSTASSPSLQTPSTARIYGTVYDSVLENPLSETDILLLDPDLNVLVRATTDEQGNYAIGGIPSGEYFLRAVRRRYMPEYFGVVTPEKLPPPVHLASSGDYNFTFFLTRAGSITGTISDPTGQPLVNVETQLLVERFDRNGRLYLAPAPEVPPVKTAVGGTYAFSSVPPGRFVVRASLGLPPGSPNDPNVSVNGNVRTYYPGTDRLEAAVFVEMPRMAADLGNVDFSFTDLPRFRVAGTIVGPDGTVLQGSLVLHLIPKATEFDRLVDPPQALLDFDPRPNAFELRDVAAGIYDLYVSRGRTVEAPEARGHLVLDVHTEVVGARVELAASVELKGEFRLDEAASELRLDLTGTKPEFYPDNRELSLVETPIPSEGNYNLNPDGSFTLTVPRGRYQVGVDVPDDLYLAEAWLGPLDVLNSVAGLDSTGSGDMLLELRGDGARFEGTVSKADGSPAQNATVVLLPSSAVADRLRSRTSMTDASGSFSIQGIAPGAYLAFAFSSVPVNAWLNEEFMSPYLGSGRPLDFNPRSLRYQNLNLISRPE